MNDLKEARLAKAPLNNLVRRRYASVPNTSGFWTDLSLARSAYRSSSVILTSIARFIAVLIVRTQIEVSAACLYAMRWRTQDDIDRPRASWDDMLMEMRWLREDFKCDVERKKIFIREVAKPCADGARQWLQRICSRSEEEGSGQVVGREPTIPGWAREEYLTRRILPEYHWREPTSEGGEASELDHTSHSSEAFPTKGKRKAETPAGARRSRRLRNLADASSS